MDLRVDKVPMTRGVTHLMYIGDDEAVEKAVTVPSKKEIGAGVVAALVALQSRGITRLVAAGIASWVGYRVYRAR